MGLSEPPNGSDLEACPLATTHTISQRYISTRGGDYGLTFEDSLFDTFTPEGGLFIPEKIPVLTTSEWREWSRLSFQEVAFELLSLYISPAEIPPDDLREIIKRSFGSDDSIVPPLVRLTDGIYLLEVFHGPRGVPEDMELRLLGNLFEYFLARRNAGKEGKDRYHVTILDPADDPAVALALGGKRDVSVIRLRSEDGLEDPAHHPDLEAAASKNIHTLAISGSVDDREDIIDALFATASNTRGPQLNLATASSVCWARSLSQMIIWIHAFFSLKRVLPSFNMESSMVRLVLATRNFDIIAPFLVRRMGLPIDKVVIATGERDPLVSFWGTCRYRRQARQGQLPDLSDDSTAKESSRSRQQPPNSRRGDVLVTSSFERILWYLAREFVRIARMGDAWAIKEAGAEVSKWLSDLVERDAFGPVYKDITQLGRRNFVAERISLLGNNRRTTEGSGGMQPENIDGDFRWDACEATTAGVVAAQRSLSRVGPNVPHISLAPVAYRKAQSKSGERGMTSVSPRAATKSKPVQKVANNWRAVRDAIIALVDKDSMRAFSD